MNPCSGHGLPTSSGTCNCDPAWMGPTCAISWEHCSNLYLFYRITFQSLYGLLLIISTARFVIVRLSKRGHVPLFKDAQAGVILSITSGSALFVAYLVDPWAILGIYSIPQAYILSILGSVGDYTSLALLVRYFVKLQGRMDPGTKRVLRGLDVLVVFLLVMGPGSLIALRSGPHLSTLIFDAVSGVFSVVIVVGTSVYSVTTLRGVVTSRFSSPEQRKATLRVLHIIRAGQLCGVCAAVLVVVDLVLYPGYVDAVHQVVFSSLYRTLELSVLSITLSIMGRSQTAPEPMQGVSTAASRGVAQSPMASPRHSKWFSDPRSPTLTVPVRKFQPMPPAPTLDQPVLVDAQPPHTPSLSSTDTLSSPKKPTLASLVLDAADLPPMDVVQSKWREPRSPRKTHERFDSLGSNSSALTPLTSPSTAAPSARTVTSHVYEPMILN